MALQLRYYDDPVLRAQAAPIEQITDEIHQLAHQMIQIMKNKDGIGLAAPQVGVSLRLFVARIAAEDEKGELHLGEPRVYINPILSNPSDLVVERSEGCLSIPKLYLPVARPFSITIEATDLQGVRFSEQTQGYVARCMMHETDHLDGKLFIDRIVGKKRKEIDPILRLIKLKYAKL